MHECVHWARGIFRQIQIQRVELVFGDLQRGVLHDEKNVEGGGEIVGAEVALEEGFVVVGGEEGVAVGEDAEDVRGELDVEGPGGDGEGVEAGAGGGIEVARDDLGVPDHACGVGLGVLVLGLYITSVCWLLIYSQYAS